MEMHNYSEITKSLHGGGESYLLLDYDLMSGGYNTMDFTFNANL